MAHSSALETQATIAATRGLVRLSRQVEITLANFELSVSQFRILDRLCGGKAAGSNLAEWLAVKPPSITALVDGLVARRLVERAADAEDRRRVAHQITHEGRKLYAEALGALEGRLFNLLEFVSDEVDAQDMLQALATWNRALERARDARQAAAAKAAEPT